MNYPEAYAGNEPYIFISYAHANSAIVLPIVEALQTQGYRVWYDGGIEAGTEWAEYIAEKVIGCSVFLAFMSQAALDSKNCRNEINMALEEKRDLLVAHIEDTRLSPGMRLQLGSVQHLFRSRYENDVAFLQDLFTAKLLNRCLGQAQPRSVVQSNLQEAKAYLQKALAMKEDGTWLSSAENKSRYALYVKEAAERGDPQAMYELGYCYLRSIGVTQDLDIMIGLYQKSAEAGYGPAQYALADRYEKGRDLPQDYGKAAYWYQKSFDAGYEPAQSQAGLGRCIAKQPVRIVPAGGITQPAPQPKKKVCKLCGYGVTDPAVEACPVCGNSFAERIKTKAEQAAEYMEKAKSIEKMFGNTEDELREIAELYKKAAELGDAAGQFSYGFVFHYGKGVPQNDALAFEWFLKAADQGEYRAQYMVGEFYENGTYVEIDLEAAVRYYEPAAAKNHPMAISGLERCREKLQNGQAGMLVAQGRKLYEQGPENNDKAFFCFQRAAELGDACGQYYLAMLYELGVGTAYDIDKALTLYTEAAKQGDEVYQKAFESCRARKTATATKCCSEGASLNTYEGRSTFGQGPLWYRRAMALGSPDGQVSLAVCYRDGSGVPQDIPKALAMLQEAAQKQYPAAHYELGNCCAKGLGMTQDDTRAVQYYRFAADRGDSMAQYELGNCYREGRGVVKDLETARAWYKKAAAQGNFLASFVLKKI